MMANSIDPQQAQRVWSRVMAAGAAPSTSTAPAAQEAAEEPAASFEAQLQELLRRARADAALNIRLARRLCGCARQTLLHLAEQSRQEARTLAALYYITTGQRAACEPVSPDAPACLAAGLRRQYERQLANAATYRALAEQAPAHAETLTCLADGSQRHARTLVCVLRDCL
mgnify:FL=1